MKFQHKHILIYKWNAYNYLDVYRTFERMGFAVDTAEQFLPSYDEDAAFFAYLTGLFSRTAYDFVFSINYFGVISDACERAGLPYVSWSCDSPLISMYHASVYNDCNYLFLFDKSNYLAFRSLGLKHIYHMPLAVDAERISYILSESRDLKLYQNEISFVGSLYERNTYDKIVTTLPEYLRGYFDCALQAQMNISGGNLFERLLTEDICAELQNYYQLEKSERSFSDLRLIFSATVLGFKAAKEQRCSFLQALAKKYAVSIYTNSNARSLVRVDYRGSVDYWTQMPKVFHESRINLNFTIPNIQSGIPLRVWDVLGAGGFLLTNYQPELELYFDIGKDLAVFESRPELEEKAAYYLSHEKERREVAERGAENVRRHHSYRQRIQQITDILKKDIES